MMQERRSSFPWVLSLATAVILVGGVWLIMTPPTRLEKALFPSARPEASAPASPSPGSPRPYGTIEEIAPSPTAARSLGETRPRPSDHDWEDDDNRAFPRENEPVSIPAVKGMRTLSGQAASSSARLPAGGAAGPSGAFRQASPSSSPAQARRTAPSGGTLPRSGRAVSQGPGARPSAVRPGGAGPPVTPAGGAVPRGAPATGPGGPAAGETVIPPELVGRVLSGGGAKGLKLQLGPESTPTQLHFEPPPGYMLPTPNMSHIVQALAAEHPDMLARACTGQPGEWDFLDLVVDTLRRSNSRWGYNCKRGNCGDPSKDVIAYYAGPGRPYQGAPKVSLVDIIMSCGGPDSKPGWIQLPYTGTGAGFTSRGRF